MQFRKTAKIVDLPAVIVADLKTMKSDAKKKKREQAKTDVEKNMGYETAGGDAMGKLIFSTSRLMRDSLYGLSETETEASDVAQELYSLYVRCACLCTSEREGETGGVVTLTHTQTLHLRRVGKHSRPQFRHTQTF